MRLRVLIDEAVRDVVSGTTRSGWLTSGFGLLLGLLVAADALAVSALVGEAHRYRDGGAATLTVVAPGGIDGASCDALARVPGVAAAGAVRHVERPLVLAILPRSPLDHYEVSAGFGDVIGVRAESAAAGIAVTEDVVAALGASVGDVVVTDRGAAPVAGHFPYPADGRRAGFGWAALSLTLPVSAGGSPAPTQPPFDECWLSVWPPSADVRSIALTAVSAAASTEERVSVTQLTTRLGATFTGAERLAARPSAGTPLLAAVLGVAVAVLSVRWRRLELAARRHDGASSTSVALLVAIESVSWLAPGAMLAVAGAAWIAAGIPSADSAAVVQSALVAAAAAVGGGLAGSALAVARVRERHLFAYFVDR